jgi:hypothetical protein
MIWSSAPYRFVYHSVRDSFGTLLRSALSGDNSHAVALGPIYELDPGAETLAPFIRSAKESSIDPDLLNDSFLAPDWVLQKVQKLRNDSVSSWAGQASDITWKDAVHWTRAGLVLEIASRRGIPLNDGKLAHVKWKMRGTVTGRFGVESGGYNPLLIASEKDRVSGQHALWRSKIVPSAVGREIVAIDFRAMDLSSMISLVPGLKQHYAGCTDFHERTAELVGIKRESAKKELFVHAYGGNSSYSEKFDKHLPELNWLRQMAHGAGARLVQQTSATAFRAALSNALPLLAGEDIKPLFTVHDELTLDALSRSEDQLALVTKALEEGASERIGVAYTVGMNKGRNYSEAKL